MKLAMILASCLVLVGCGDSGVAKYSLDNHVYSKSVDFKGCNLYTKIEGAAVNEDYLESGDFCTDQFMRFSALSTYVKTWRGMEWQLGDRVLYQTNSYYGLINKFIPE